MFIFPMWPQAFDSVNSFAILKLKINEKKFEKIINYF